MERDKKAESARVVGYFCMGLAMLTLVVSIVLTTGSQPGTGLILLVVGLALLTVGIVTVASGRPKRPDKT